MFFEGPEKKVEIVFEEGLGLTSKGKDFWSQIVQESQAQILSEIHNDHSIAYLLSESSLFVFESKIVMITCGRTTLVKAIESLVNEFGPSKVKNIIYERKNEHHPEYQHSNFEDDANMLNGLVPGRAVRFGELDLHHINMFYTTNHFLDPIGKEITIELLMHGISPELSKVLSESNPNWKNESKAIRQLDEDFEIDEYVFSPYGYSMNGLNGKEYFTIHVTPQKDGSYVSFEANVYSLKWYEQNLPKIIDFFKPKSFDILSFQNSELQLEKLGYIVNCISSKELENGLFVKYISYMSPNSIVLPTEIQLKK